MASPKPTTVIFVRHGTTETTGKVLPGRAPGLHLSESGLTAAEEAGEALAKLGSVAAVYSSPLERTKETAAAIARACGLKVQTNRNLIELDPGDWTGKSLRLLRKKPEWQLLQFSPSRFAFPGGESVVEVGRRMQVAVEEMCAAHPGEVVVAVSHGDPINLAVADALGIHMDLMQRIIISPTSVSVVIYEKDRPIVTAVNATPGSITERIHP